MSEAPPAYYEILSEAPPAYSDASVDLAAQLEQMKATMKLEKGNMMWKMHLQKEEMIEKMEQMRLEKEAMMEQMRLEKEAMMEQMRLKMDTRICEEKERVKTEKKVFVAKEKHWSSDFDVWNKRYDQKQATRENNHGYWIPESFRSIVSAFLKTIPTETVYAMHSISIVSGGFSNARMYIATDSKVYTLDYYGVANGPNYQISPPSAFKAIVTFPSEPTPTFWRAVFSQIGSYNTQGLPIEHGNTVFQHDHNGNNEIFRVATAKLEALFHSFR
jgi:hypothetical protein